MSKYKMDFLEFYRVVLYNLNNQLNGCEGNNLLMLTDKVYIMIELN